MRYQKPNLTLEKKTENRSLAGYSPIKLPAEIEKNYLDNFLKVYHIKGVTVTLQYEPVGRWYKQNNREGRTRDFGIVARLYPSSCQNLAEAKRILIKQGYKLQGGAK